MNYLARTKNAGIGIKHARLRRVDDEAPPSVDGRRLLLLVSGFFFPDDDGGAWLAALLLLGNFLLLSYLSHDDALPGLLLVLPGEHGLEPDKDEDDGLELPGLGLCVSHLSTVSARPGFGLEDDFAGKKTGMHVAGKIAFLGGVGSRPGRTAFAMARCTRATGITMDQLSEDDTQMIQQRSRR